MWRRLIAMAVMATLLMSGAAHAQAPAGLGTEEFGLSQRQLVQAIEQVEALIAKCMRDQGFRTSPSIRIPCAPEWPPISGCPV